MKRRLFILVEGEDDVRFFGRIVKPLFTGRYDSIEIVPYACTKREKVSRFLRSIRQMNNEYIFVADIDNEKSVLDKKQILMYHYNDLDSGDILIVIREIESWYLAGLSAGAAHHLGMQALITTDTITKEDFNRTIPARFKSRIDFMFELLKFFSLAEAIEKNHSFSFFVHRYHVEEADGLPGRPAR